MSENGSNPIGPTGSSGKHSRGGRSSGGHGHGRGPERNGQGGRGNHFSASNFKGNTEGMNGKVFQCYNKSLDKKQFARTLEALGEYTAKNMEYPGDLGPIFKTLSVPTITAPAELTAEDKKSKLKCTIWEKQVATYCKRLDIQDSNMKALHAVIWGQCSAALKAKLTSLDDFEAKHTAADCIWLLKEIKGIMFSFESQRYVVSSLDSARVTLWTCQQGPEETLADYLHHFRTNVEAFEHYGGTIGNDTGLIDFVKALPDAPTAADKIRKQACDCTLALAFVKRADPRCFGLLCTDLDNQYTRGNDQYPVDLTGAYSLLVNYRAPRQHHGPCSSHSTPGTAASSGTAALTFAQTSQTSSSSNPVPGLRGSIFGHITCYQCHCVGHYANDCPSSSSAPSGDVQLCQTTNPSASSFSFAQHASSPTLIPSEWVLLDSQSTVSIFCNASLLRNIRSGPTTLHVQWDPILHPHRRHPQFWLGLV
ncbi:hypothetical protein ACA910_005537 [Epithemia clementina (nom. ined.)]